MNNQEKAFVAYSKAIKLDRDIVNKKVDNKEEAGYELAEELLRFNYHHQFPLFKKDES